MQKDPVAVVYTDMMAWIEAQVVEHQTIIQKLVSKKGGNLFMAGGHAVAVEALMDVRSEMRNRLTKHVEERKGEGSES